MKLGFLADRSIPVSERFVVNEMSGPNVTVASMVTPFLEKSTLTASEMPRRSMLLSIFTLGVSPAKGELKVGNAEIFYTSKSHSVMDGRAYALFMKS